MGEAPGGSLLHIAVFGRRNAGKTTLIHALSGREDAAAAGTDLNFVSAEIMPLGKVVLIDTVSIDEPKDGRQDHSGRSREVMEHIDLALMMFSDENPDITLEKQWVQELLDRNIPVIGVINKVDRHYIDEQPLKMTFRIPFIKISAMRKTNLGGLRTAMDRYAPVHLERVTILGDLVRPKDVVVIVTPGDSRQNKGRIINQQMQLIRDVIDSHAASLIVCETELMDVLETLKHPPRLVVADTRVFMQVNEMLPTEIPLTSLSFLMARYKGDLELYLQGARVIDSLKPGDEVLIAEACNQHPINGDLHNENVAECLERHTGGKLVTTVCVGSELPENLDRFRMVIHCGSCSMNRKQVMSRLDRINERKIPVTSCGVAIAHMHGMTDRALQMFV